MIKVAVVGATGYAGEELIKILLRHPSCKITYICAKIEGPKKFSDIFNWAKGKLDLVCDNPDMSKFDAVDIVFLALPHKASMGIAPLILEKRKIVIDLSADYRLKDTAEYEKWYGVKQSDQENLKKAVYGLPEFYRKEIKAAKLIANPGCYPTAAILAIAPLLKKKLCEAKNIIIDTKSGYSGAGRKEPDDPFWKAIKDNFKAYKVDAHQHSPEINQELSNAAGEKIKATFVPHLLPIERGILETIYLKVKSQKSKVKNLIEFYKDFYKDAAFVRIKNEDEFPQLSDVRNTNFCDIGVKVNQESGLIIIISCIDNLVKGVAGQAVQNMNIICGFKETEGLL